jgi:phytoene dehydrogenase-like protein
MEKDLIIVGAGISGLTAGCYAQLNGYSTTIFEMHSLPGGLCTAWERKGYKWDSSMHMLTGSVTGPFHQMWKELGVIRKFKFHYHDHMTQVESGGKKLLLSTDRDQLERDMLDQSPEDAGLIRELLDHIYGQGIINAALLKPPEWNNLLDSLKLFVMILPSLGMFRKYGRVSLQEFTSRFKDPFLRDAIRFFIDSPGWPMPDFPMVAMAGYIKNMIQESGVPVGGSQQVMFHLESLYKDRGGEVRYKSRVKELIVENDRVLGIRLEDGSEHRAEKVLWAGDGHTLIFDLLGGKYIDDRIRKIYDTWIPVKPMLQVTIGVNRDMSKELHSYVLGLDEPLVIAGEEHRWMTMLHHSFHGTMAPAGKTALEVWFATDYTYWEELAGNRKEYNAEKKRIVDFCIARLDERWPGFASQVEVAEVATPHTYVRYTGNWKGSPDGWYITTKNMREQIPLRTLPGLDGLYMSGQWTVPFAGTVYSAASARQIIQILCRKDHRKFKAA